MGSFEASGKPVLGKPVFISEDNRIIKKKLNEGGVASIARGNERTDLERRMYSPEWLQHEFF